MLKCCHREEWRARFLERLRDPHEDCETDPVVREEILERTRAWINDTQPDLDNHCTNWTWESTPPPRTPWYRLKPSPTSSLRKLPTVPSPGTTGLDT
jgi:hypothetical protein